MMGGFRQRPLEQFLGDDYDSLTRRKAVKIELAGTFHVPTTMTAIIRHAGEDASWRGSPFVY
ncbi:MAG: hypothetical protein M2R45_04796 [Verrucomicrobia subdivision 3 bacterium]|nr:hypothetical protein [Limisphaerales bacterium]MCS1417441.1 hypothetical protein [Limisphaerales bacterium]